MTAERDHAGAVARARRGGLAVVSVFAIVLALWGSVVRLSGAVIVAGEIRTVAPVHVLHHAEGGVLAEIRVREGDRIAAGAVLLRLDNTEAAAERAHLIAERLGLRVDRARISAELERRAALALDPDLAAEISGAGLAPRLDQARQRLATVYQTEAAERARLAAALQAADRTVAELRRRADVEFDRAARAGERGIALERLRAQGYLSERAFDEIDGAYSALLAAEAETRADLERARRERLDLAHALARLGEADDLARLDELARIDRQIPELDFRIARLGRRIRASEIVSPIAGTAIDLRYAARGAVVAPHQPILEIVPAGEHFHVEVRIAPRDIDRVAPGMRADVVLSAFAQRELPRIAARVATVSPDRRAQAEGGAEFTAVLALDPASLAAADRRVPFDLTLRAGMPAEAFILTEDDTLLGHLLAPVRQTLARGFRDG